MSVLAIQYSFFEAFMIQPHRIKPHGYRCWKHISSSESLSEAGVHQPAFDESQKVHHLLSTGDLYHMLMIFCT